MARSSYVWVVQSPSGEVVNAFTVKHELASWLEGRESQYLVTRVRDGALNPELTQLNPHTLEPAL